MFRFVNAYSLKKKERKKVDKLRFGHIYRCAKFLVVFMSGEVRIDQADALGADVHVNNIDALVAPHTPQAQTQPIARATLDIRQQRTFDKHNKQIANEPSRFEL